MDCGTLLDGSGATDPTTALPVAGQPPPTPVPLRIVEQTTPLPITPQPITPQPTVPITPIPITAPTATAPPPAAAHEVAGMVWHPIAHDPWPTPRSSPTVVAAPLRPGPVVVAGLAAAVLGLAGSLVTAGSYRFADGTDVRFTLDDLRTNSFGVMLAAAVVVLAGAVLATWRQRVGVGIVGGAAVATVGLVAMGAALVVAQLLEAKRAGLATGVVTITWEPGFYLLVGAGLVGLLAGALALGAWRDGAPPVPAVVGVLGVVAAAAMVVGALIPPEGRTWSDNLGIDGFGTVPSWLRLGALALVGAAAVVGFASRRRWALGLAAASTAALAAQWVGVLDPPVPNRRGGPGIAITPLEHTALTVNAAGLVAVVALALVGWLLGARRRA